MNSDTKLYLSPNSYNVGAIRHFQDDYYQSGGGDFNWSLDSRVKWNFGGSIITALVSAYSTTSAGVYDFYGNCEFSNITSFFPNLKSEDAIQTAPATTNYNCGSWAGGITSFWWFPDVRSPWNGTTDLQSFDNFYGNNPARYAGAYTYTRSGANAGNVALALWYNSAAYYPFTHVSVHKPGNDHPHGYSWESKLGQLMRTMHPRDALQGSGPNGYGSILYYYQYTGANARLAASKRPMTLEESIRSGLSKLDQENFEEQDKQLLNKLKDKLTSSDISSA